MAEPLLNAAQQALQEALGHRFARTDLFLQALTHRSFGAVHYERLEFLGDSILNCAVSDLLYRRHVDLDEGQLSRVRSHLVRQDTLASLGRRLNLPECMRVGAGERRQGFELKDSIVADCLEALIGAVALDSSFDAASACVLALMTPVLDATPLNTLGKDAKTRLQELLQGRRLELPVYRVLVEGGTQSSPHFRVECDVQALGLKSEGLGTSRKTAEQSAAQAVLNELEGKQAS